MFEKKHLCISEIVTISSKKKKKINDLHFYRKWYKITCGGKRKTKLYFNRNTSYNTVCVFYFKNIILLIIRNIILYNM